MAGLGAVLSLTGSAIKTAYPGTPQMSPPIVGGRIQKLRFWVSVNLNSSSSITSVNVKLSQRYDDGTNQSTYLDIPSTLDDVQGSAQPKGSTYELEHTLAVTAGATTWLSFSLLSPTCLNDLVVQVKANASPNSADIITVYANAQLG